MVVLTREEAEYIQGDFDEFTGIYIGDNKDIEVGDKVYINYFGNKENVKNIYLTFNQKNSNGEIKVNVKFDDDKLYFVVPNKMKNNKTYYLKDIFIQKKENNKIFAYSAYQEGEYTYVNTLDNNYINVSNSN